MGKRKGRNHYSGGAAETAQVGFIQSVSGFASDFSPRFPHNASNFNHGAGDVCFTYCLYFLFIHNVYDNRTLWGSSSEEVEVRPQPASGDRPHRRATSAAAASVSARSASAAAAADRGPPSAVRQTGPRAGGLRETGRGRRDDAASQQGHLDGLHEPRRDEAIFRRQNRLLAGDGRGPGEELWPRVPIACLRQHAQWVSGFYLEILI